MKKLLLVVSTALYLSSCTENEDIVQTPTRDGDIEISIGTSPISNGVVYTTTSKIYVKNTHIKTISTSDTIPNLGFTKEEGENSNGDVAEITIPKEYEIYVTVK